MDNFLALKFDAPSKFWKKKKSEYYKVTRLLKCNSSINKYALFKFDNLN